MAQIIGLREKQAALTEINHKIKSLEPVNKFLESENPDGIYTLSHNKLKTPILCKDSNTIKALVLAYKKELVNEIRAMAEKYSIEFNEDDEAALK